MIVVLVLMSTSVMARPKTSQEDVNVVQLLKKRLNNTVADCQTDPNDYRCPCPRCDPPGSCNCPPCNCNINPTDCYECPCTLCLQRIVSYCPPICDATPCCDACGGFVASGTCPK